uniref:HTH CENPB-type domain-containing protein n=1 Tax=Hyaloperonospora arabidopsidis (strain Emoy2) TaxID=559515 RepID=M4B9T1_HYAAE
MLLLPVGVISEQYKMSQIRLTNGKRLRLCKHKDENPDLSQTALAKWATVEFCLVKTLSQASISKIFLKRSNLENTDPSSLNAKRQRLVQHPILEEAVSLWFLQCQHRGVIITGDIICAKAHRLAQLLGTPDDAITFLARMASSIPATSHALRYQHLRMRSTVTSVGRVLTSTKSTNLLPCVGRWLPGTRFQALPLPIDSATRGFFLLNRSFQVQWK